MNLYTFSIWDLWPHLKPNEFNKSSMTSLKAEWLHQKPHDFNNKEYWHQPTRSAELQHLSYNNAAKCDCFFDRLCHKLQKAIQIQGQASTFDELVSQAIWIDDAQFCVNYSPQSAKGSPYKRSLDNSDFYHQWNHSRDKYHRTGRQSSHSNSQLDVHLIHLYSFVRNSTWKTVVFIVLISRKKKIL